MYLNRIASAFVALGLLAGPTVGFGQSAVDKKPLAKMTCEDFIGLDDSFKPRLVYWGVAYSDAGKPQGGGVSVEGIERIILVVVQECKKAPKESFWQKVKAEVKKIEKKL